MRKGDIISSGFSYLFECGVLDVICLLPGSTTTLYKADEIDSTLSFITTPESGVGLGNRFIMEQPSELTQMIYLWDAAKANNLPTEELKRYFQSYIKTNTKFSKEELYRIVKLQNHACGLKFIPTSETYKVFRQDLAVTEFIFDNTEEELSLASFTHNNERHFGIMKFKSINDLTPEQKSYMEKKGVNTSDIYEISHL